MCIRDRLHDSPLPLCITRRHDGRFIDANDACARFLGTTREALLDATALDVGLWPSDDERRRALAAGASTRTWTIVRTNPLGVRIRAHVCAVQHGGDDYLLGFCIDDEARVKAEHALALERDFTQTILDTSGQGIVVADREDRLLYANAAFADLVGVPPGDLLGRAVTEFVEPAHAERYAAELARRRQGLRGLYETEMVHRSGARRSVLVTAIPHPVEEVGGSVALITDLTLIKQAHAEIERQRAFYEDIVQRLPMRLVLVDRDWRFRLVNHRAVPHDGLRAQCIGRTFEEVAEMAGLETERIAHFQAAKARVMKTMEPVEWTEDVMERGPSGERDHRVSLLQRLEPLHGTGGALLGYLGLAVDISDRVEAERRIEEQRRFYETLVNALPVQVAILDDDFRITYLNPVTVPNADARAASIGQTYAAVCESFRMPPDVCDRMRTAVDTLRRTGTSVEWVDDLGPDAPIRHVLRRLLPLSAPDDDGARAYLSLGIDLTARVEGEQKSEAQRRFYEGVLDRLPLDVTVFDPSGRFLYVAPGVLPDAAREAALGRRHVDLPGLDPALARRFDAWIDDALATGTTQTCEVLRPSDEDDGPREHLHVAVPIHRPDGDVEVVVAYRLDVTERKRHEASLLAAKAQAEGLSRAKSAFLANMSHEVRTPLTGIIGFAEVLAGELTGPQSEAATLIRESGLRLLDTLNSVLSLARLEANALDLTLVPVDIGAEACAAAKMFQGLLAARGVVLRVDMPAAPTRGLADVAALHRVLVNLLSNATKFTTQGEVHVAVGDDPAHGPFVRIRDTGEGIDAAFLPHLFEEFRQESTGLARAHQGSGLGLSITRRLVDLMNGRIQVESVKGEGTTCTVHLPRA